MSIKVTVIKGKCQGDFHDIGKSFTVDWKTPEGMCISAWDAISPFVLTLSCGGNLPWEKEKGTAIVHCPDPKGIVLELRRMDD